ncbi:MAG TPA: M12 family metallopeptidase [Longimicrobium sp.]|uniref:M12 family metallopeptidase n=1 Tax=Longimicrobium sp. TaxID=2029185 RepID=UPI002ED9A276
MKPNLLSPAILAIALSLTACQDAIVNPPSDVSPPSPASAQLQKGFIFREGEPFEVAFEVHDGRAVFEGDIDLGPVSEIARTRDELLGSAPGQGGTGPRLGVVTSNTDKRWVNGVVGYVIESNVPDQSRITGAIAHIEANVGGVDLQPRTTHSSYIIFRRTTDPEICGSSPVGRVGGGQVVLIRDDCDIRTAIHEIGHALGFWHEQSRCDRDDYVQILWSNIKSAYKYAFDKFCSNIKPVTDIGTYDEYSVMHYDSTRFGLPDGSGGKLQTINSLRGLNGVMGVYSSLSSMDAYTIDVMYRPYPVANYQATYPGNVPTLSWSASARATSYEVYLVEDTEEYIMDRGTFYYHNATHLTSTSNTSWSDPNNTYTGSDHCTLYNDSGWYNTDYWYDVYAVYATGVSSQVARVDAKIGC